jgi:hypothetical protein
LILIKHENFPDGVANVIRHFEYQYRGETLLKFPQEIYGDEVKPDEWLPCVAKQSKSARPVILTVAAGIRENSLSTRAMKESGCNFVVLLKAWADQPLASFTWRILKCWPEVIQEATAVHDAGRQSRIEVSLHGRIVTTSL